MRLKKKHVKKICKSLRDSYEKMDIFMNSTTLDSLIEADGFLIIEGDRSLEIDDSLPDGVIHVMEKLEVKYDDLVVRTVVENLKMSENTKKKYKNTLLKFPDLINK